MDLATQSNYDEILYHSWPFSQSHPDRLATVATLFGMDPAPVMSDCFRMLELGSGCGDNLIPLALQHPHAEFVGVDLSPVQVNFARQAATQLGVANVRFECADMMEFPVTGEPFDFISAHGVYSWVPSAVRDRLLAVCKGRLQPHGVAYVSYNVYPGCQIKQIIRDLLLYHIRDLKDPRQRIQQAFAFLRFMAHKVPHDNPAYTALYQGTLQSLGDDGAAETRLFHDLLESTNDPVYFHEFVAHAAQHELQFLAEADVSEMQSMRFPAEVRSVLDQLAGDVIQHEQYLDFIKHRPFRQTLLCHQDVALQRSLQLNRIPQLLVASEIQCDTPKGDLRSNEPFHFRGPKGVEADIDHPLTKAALLVLGESSPRAAPFAELEAAARRRLQPEGFMVQASAEFERQRREFLEHLAQLYAAGLVQFHIHHPQFTLQVGERPIACPWARLQAERGPKVTNRWHVGVALAEINRQLLLLLDGKRDQHQLLEELARRMEQQGLVVVHEGVQVPGKDEARQALHQIMSEALRKAASLALLVG